MPHNLHDTLQPLKGGKFHSLPALGKALTGAWFEVMALMKAGIHRWLIRFVLHFFAYLAVFENSCTKNKNFS